MKPIYKKQLQHRLIENTTKEILVKSNWVDEDSAEHKAIIAAHQAFSSGVYPKVNDKQLTSTIYERFVDAKLEVTTSSVTKVNIQ